MDNLTRTLKNADPLRHEPSNLDASRDRIVAAALNDAERRAPRIQTRRTPLLTACAVLLLLAAAITYQVRSASTRVLAAVPFEIRLAEDQPRPGLTVGEVGASGRLVYLYAEPVVDNADVAQAWVDGGPDDQFGVTIQLLPAGAEKMKRATADHIGRPVAVFVDGSIAAAPTLRSIVSDMASINGQFTRAEAERIAAGVVPR